MVCDPLPKQEGCFISHYDFRIKREPPSSLSLLEHKLFPQDLQLQLAWLYDLSVFGRR